jgi:hypothetical protein
MIKQLSINYLDNYDENNFIKLCNCNFENKSPKEYFQIDYINYKNAKNLIIKYHYLHRQAPCSKSFGLFCKNCNKVVGVIIYGISCSSTLLKGICGDEEKGNVYELTRLWIKDGTPKNSESFLIGNTLKLLDKEIIVSFAEIQQGHAGTIYQASNFIYCGLSAKFKDPKIKGLEHKHHATYANGLNMSQIVEKYGIENVYYVERPRKHRYIYFNAKGKRKKELLNKLKYKIYKYPKNTI